MAGMDIPYEKMSANESTSSAILIDGPIQVQQPPVRIRHYFVFSLFSALCLCPATGLIALAYSLKSSAKADVKFHDKARLYSRRALLWNLVSLVFAIFSILMLFVFCYYLNEMMRIYTYQVQDMFEKQQRSKDFPGDINKMLQSLTDETQ